MTKVTVRETASGWTDGTSTWETAAEAQKTLRAAALLRAQAQGGVDILILEWVPTTTVGLAVVKAIAEEKREWPTS